jgi:UPF0176 protein
VREGYLVATFYQFADLDQLEEKQRLLRAQLDQLGLVGSVLLGSEGVNGTLCGTRESIDAILAYLRGWSGLEGMRHQESMSEKPAFARAKVKLKEEIVSLGVEGIAPHKKTGIHVPAQRWHELIQEADVTVLDTRNKYEYRVGTFTGAMDPQIESFREFPEFVRQTLDPTKHRRIAMFCTGGIRCEKASAWMLEQGFSEVYQLEGGILSYLQAISEEESLWKGACFVFDERIGLEQGLRPAALSFCPRCGEPLTEEERAEMLSHAHSSCRYCPQEAEERPSSQAS